jgi:endo-1,4-beta-xylanase
MAAGHDKLVGSVIGSYILPNFTAYWNQVTPENAGKWDNVEVKKDVFVWDTPDTIYNYAIKNNIAFKFHNLIWGKQQPKWMNDLDSA